MAGQHQAWHEGIQDDERHGAELKCVAHGDKGRHIITLGEKLIGKHYQVYRKRIPFIGDGVSFFPCSHS